MKGNMRLQQVLGPTIKQQNRIWLFFFPLFQHREQQLCLQPSSLWVASVDAVGVTSARLRSNQDEENELSVHCMSSGLLASDNSAYCSAAAAPESHRQYNALPSSLYQLAPAKPSRHHASFGLWTDYRNISGWLLTCCNLKEHLYKVRISQLITFNF